METYGEDITKILADNQTVHHIFADDFQILTSSSPQELNKILRQTEKIISEIQLWYSSKSLQLNADKTEVLLFGTNSRLSRIQISDYTLNIGDSSIKFSPVVRDLGVFLDSSLSLKSHIQHVSQNYFFHLRRLRSIRPKIDVESSKHLVSSLIFSRIDYCNALFASLPNSTLQPLQRVN